MGIRKKNDDSVTIQIPLPLEVHQEMVQAAKVDRRTRKDFVTLAVMERAQRIMAEHKK